MIQKINDCVIKNSTKYNIFHLNCRTFFLPEEDEKIFFRNGNYSIELYNSHGCYPKKWFNIELENIKHFITTKEECGIPLLKECYDNNTQGYEIINRGIYFIAKKKEEIQIDVISIKNKYGLGGIPLEEMTITLQKSYYIPIIKEDNKIKYPPEDTIYYLQKMFEDNSDKKISPYSREIKTMDLYRWIFNSNS